MNWYEGVYNSDFDIGSGSGGSSYQDFYGFTPSNSNYRGGGGWGGPGGGSNQPGIGIDINIPIGGGGGGGGGKVPSVNQVLTDIVNSYERLLAANLGDYQTGTKKAETAYNYAKATFDEMITLLLGYGEAGERSASERDRRRNPALLKWDWILYYIDPIVGGAPSDSPGGAVSPRVPNRGPNPPYPLTNPNAGNLPSGPKQDNTLLYLALAVTAFVILSK
jgi:hypothetical protein